MIKCIDELFAKFDGAFADNTIRAYRSDYNHFSDWCTELGINPLESSSDDWVAYIECLVEESSPATISRRINSLETIFKLGEWQSYKKHPDVILALKRMYRKKGRAQQQATPLTRQILYQLIAQCRDDTRGLRNRVMLLLGYETMRRRSELCSFKFDNIEIMPNGLKAIVLERSKTDQFGQGKLISISDELFALLQTWEEIVGGGYILRGINQHLQFTRQLNPATVNIILKQLQASAGIELKQDLSGHSFRVGRALDLLMEGEPLEKIMLRGGWKSESTAMRYLRSWSELSR